MHAVTRLGRVIQQLRSFGELHAGELEALAAELDAANAADVAARVRTYRDMQRDEAQLVVDELVDIQADMASTAQREITPGDLLVDGTIDPAINSPRRARWLAEQAAEEERRRQPRSRREFFRSQKSEVRSQTDPAHGPLDRTTE